MIQKENTHLHLQLTYKMAYEKRCHLTISVILKRLKKALLQHLPINKLKPMPGMLLGIWEVMIICYKVRRLIVFIHRCNAKQS